MNRKIILIIIYFSMLSLVTGLYVAAEKFTPKEYDILLQVYAWDTIMNWEDGSTAFNLINVNGGVNGQNLILRTASNSRDVTIRDEVDNIKLSGGNDFTLDTMYDNIMFIYDTHGGGFWVEMSRDDVD